MQNPPLDTFGIIIFVIHDALFVQLCIFFLFVFLETGNIPIYLLDEFIKVGVRTLFFEQIEDSFKSRSVDSPIDVSSSK
jgi:hypothetical protein